MTTCVHNWQLHASCSLPGEFSRYQCALCAGWGYSYPKAWGKRTIHPYKGTPTPEVLLEWEGTLERSYSLSSPLGAKERGAWSSEQFRAKNGKLYFWDDPRDAREP